jgi:hypothetical protein
MSLRVKSSLLLIIAFLVHSPSPVANGGSYGVHGGLDELTSHPDCLYGSTGCPFGFPAPTVVISSSSRATRSARSLHTSNSELSYHAVGRLISVQQAHSGGLLLLDSSTAVLEGLSALHIKAAKYPA